MFKKYRIVRLLCLGAAVLFVLFICLTTIPIPVNGTFPAMELRAADPDYSCPRTVTISGHYHINVISPSMFYGQITVSGYRLTEQEMRPVGQAGKTGSLKYDWISVSYWLDDAEVHGLDSGSQTFGFLFAKSFMHVGLIGIPDIFAEDPSLVDGPFGIRWTDSKGYYVAWPAENEWEAQRIYNKLQWPQDKWPPEDE